MSSFGLTQAGFIAKKQSDIIAEMRGRIRTTFGSNVNLDDRAVFGQYVGIASEREALLWELAEAVYNALFPGGAEGVTVDNILALNGMRRLEASASRTDPTPVHQANGITLNGLVLYGTPGTVIAAGSIIQADTSPQQSFTLDQEAIIQAGVDAIQAIIYSNTPTSGGYNLAVTSHRTGDVATLAPVWNTLAQDSQMTWSSAATSGLFSIMLEDNLFGPFIYNASDATIQAAIRAVYTTSLVSAGRYNISPGFQPRLRFNATRLGFTSAPSTGAFTLSLNGTPTASITAPATAADVQAAVRAVTGFANTSVYKDPAFAQYYFNWEDAATPTLTVSANTTGVTTAVTSTNTTGKTITVLGSLQSLINNIKDADGIRPYSDVQVTASGSIFQAAFGAFSAHAGDVASGDKPIPLMVASANTMLAGLALTTVNIAQYSEGARPRAVGSATSTVKGPKTVVAGQLSIIGSPVSGWASVTNDLDVLPGTDSETDIDALARRETLLSGHASGPLPSIVASVLGVPGVTSAVAFANLNDAAVQEIHFASVPGTPATSFKLTLPGVGTTAALAYNATAQDVQTALRTFTGFGRTLVTGSPLYGFTVDFNGSDGGQRQPLMSVADNTTGVIITPALGRAAKSFEVLVLGGEPQALAQAIFQKMPAGGRAYGSPVNTTTADLTSGDAVIVVADATGLEIGLAVFGAGLVPGVTVIAVAGTDITLSSAATATLTGTPVSFDHTILVSDDAGDIIPVSFTRPTATLVYVDVQLVTDTYRTPGDPGSGANPNAKFQPSSMATIQADLLTIGAAVAPGGIIIGKGTQGLVGAFNETPGIIDYTLAFGLSASPTLDDPIQLLPTQAPSFQASNITVSYS